jgi:hypothetical protein
MLASNCEHKCTHKGEHYYHIVMQTTLLYNIAATCCYRSIAAHAMQCNAKIDNKPTCGGGGERSWSPARAGPVRRPGNAACPAVSTLLLMWPPLCYSATGRIEIMIVQ